jgi:ABC-type branched-subunit amino acid transport system substrate-binding protein
MFAQQEVEYSAEAEKFFSDALALYKKGDYKGAALAFERVTQSSTPNQRTTAALVMKGKAHVYSGDYTEAEKTLKSLLTQYPSSDYKGDAEYTLGLMYLGAQLPEKALESLITCWKTVVAQPSSAVLQDELVAAMDSTVDNYISLSLLQQLVSQVPGGSEKEFLLLKLGQKQAAAGDFKATAATLSLLRGDYANSTFPERLSDLQTELSRPHDLKLGLLLPLFQKNEQAGREREIGVGLYEGISFALEEYSKNPQATKITLEARDTEREPSIAAEALNTLADDASVLGIIGPAFSHEALAVSGQANEKGIPTITPTANANGIAATGPFVFQANPDLETRARAMASYAINILKLKRLAVLASNEQTSKALAEAFAKDVVRLGAEMVATEWYDKGTTNLTRQLTNLRKKGNDAAQEPYIAFNERMTQRELSKLNKLGISMKVLDTLMATRRVVNATDFLGENAKSKLDAIGIPYTSSDPRIDSLQRIVTAIQGLYCPMSSSTEIGVVSSQIAFFGIETKMLGSGEWNNISELNANKRYCKGAVFESDTYTDSKEADYADFTNRFSQRYNRLPNKNNLYGYDVATLVLSIIQKGATTREQLKNALSEVRSYKSLHSKISFSPRRVSSWLHILEYSNETIQRVAEIEAE